MSYYDMQGPVRKIFPAIIAGIALILAGALSIGGINIFGAYFGFGFIPLLAIAVWPRRANTLLSLAFVFIAGLFTDWAIGGVTGQSALLFTVIWGVLRPELRGSPYSSVGLIFAWIAICVFAVILLSVSGGFVYGVFPDLMALGRQVILATALLPLIIWLRHVVVLRMGDNEAWGA